MSKRFQSKKCFCHHFSLFSCVRTSVIVKKIIKSTFILVKRAWIQHWKKVAKKVKTPNALKICFLLRYFSWKTFFLETGIERNQVKNENYGRVFLGFVFFWKIGMCFKSLRSNSNWALKIRGKLVHNKQHKSNLLEGGSLVSFHIAKKWEKNIISFG